MGRYDKIKVYNGNEWVKPSRIRVYNNGSWRDFGLDQSGNTESLHVRQGNVWHRVTLNRKETVIPGESYSKDSFELLPASSYGFNPSYGVSDFKLEFVARKTTNDTMVVFRSGNSTNKCLFKVEWLDTGAFKITVATQYGTSTTYSRVTNATVPANTWADVKIRAYKETDSNSSNWQGKLSITINGVTQTMGGFWYYWAINNATNTVGQAGLQFKDTFFIQAHTYISASKSGTKQVTINMNEASGATNDHTAISHVNTSSTEIAWI